MYFRKKLEKGSMLTFSCIAIPGLAGHPFGSWKQRTAQPSTFMWLRDWIPKIPGIRVYTFGYDTRLPQSQSVQTTGDIALALVTKLKTFGFMEGKSLIFLAHSLGGIVLKRSITTMAEDSSAKALIDLVSAVFLFGVPNKGMAMSHLLPMVDGYPNEALVRSLAPSSAYLERLDHSFTSVAKSHSIKVISAYETEKSLTMEQNSSGKWTVTGPPEYLVDKLSAIQASSVDDFPINKNHSEMVKFGPDDANCGIVMSRIAKLKANCHKHNGKQAVQAVSPPSPMQIRQGSIIETSARGLGRLGVKSLDQLTPTELREACIHSLKFRTQHYRQEDILPSHANTCDWFFATEQWKKWQSRTQVQEYNGVLWVKGNPGSGKSTLMKHALLHFQNNVNKYVIAAYFFHARGDTLEKSYLGMLRSLLSQVAEQNPTICNELEQVFSRMLRSDSDFRWTIKSLRNFFLEQIPQRRSPPTVFFIDALDECSDAEVRNVVSFLEDLGSSATSRGAEILICLSSRHYPTIAMKRNLELVMESESEHFKDITVYVRDRLRVTDRQIEENLLRMASGIFMWVVLVTEMLNEAYDRGDIPAVHEKLNSVPEGLGKLFNDLLKDLSRESVLLFQWVLFSQRSLSIGELYYSVKLGMASGSTDNAERFHISVQDKQRFITTCSRGLVECRGGWLEEFYCNENAVEHKSTRSTAPPNRRTPPPSVQPKRPRPSSLGGRLKSLFKRGKAPNAEALPSARPPQNPQSREQINAAARYESTKVQFIHQSVKDFLTENDRLHKLCPELNENFYGESHAALARCCLNRLLVLADESSSSRHQAIPWIAYPFVRYAASSIIYHLDLAQQEGFAQTSLVAELLLDPTTFRLYKCVCDELAITHGPYGATEFSDASPAYVVVSFEAANVLDTLISLGVNLDEKGGTYGCALQHAVRICSDSLVRTLLLAGADINLVSGVCGTALQAAVEWNNKAMVEYLIAAGADVNVKGGKYGSALGAARALRRSTVEEVLRKAGAE